ncbi:MAG: DUF1844 domain-containing protein [Ignavibacteriae bacterium]|nr:DUF1844 domain-containing protein [Ignavibacteria bacterium]MBI3364070.1 DUF1844 domain-containing protein [Ignavibacteriota bacterium]
MNVHEKNTLLLTQLVALFQAAALQHMGKLKNPLTDKIEQDLPQAQISIDMLEMMHVKMKGNLSNDEERILSTVLSELKLNYVDEVTKAQAGSQQQSAAPQQATTTTPAP